VSSPDAAVPPEAVLRLVAARLPRGGVLLLDGRSGSGKSVLAAWLAPRLGARVLAMEDLYCGWDGLARAAEELADRVLPAWRAARVASWPRWDWVADRVQGSGHLRPGGTLIVEGCGALTAASRPLADLAVALDVDAAVRAERIRRRDPASALPGHRRWTAQERRLAVRDPAPRLADVVLRGGVRLPPVRRERPAVRDTVSA
jgi:uridine kinase